MAKGQKTGGREAGTPNKLTKELRQILKNIIHKELEQLPELLDKLDTKDRIGLMIKFLPYALPKVDNIKYSVHEPSVFEW